MEICKYYKEGTRKSARYSQYTGKYSHSVSENYSYCSGTKEQEECDCSGCRARCTHYPEEREKYNNEKDSEFKSKHIDLLNSIELNKELVKAIICFSDTECDSHCEEYACSVYTKAYSLDYTKPLFYDLLKHIRELNNIINEQQVELNKTRQFIHNNDLTFELLNFSTK